MNKLFKLTGVAILVLYAGTVLQGCRTAEQEIEANKVYVIAVFRTEIFNQDNRLWEYTYEYKYNNRYFLHQFSNQSYEYGVASDTLFLKISKRFPGFAKELLDIKFRNCSGTMEIPENGWDKIPECFVESNVSADGRDKK